MLLWINMILVATTGLRCASRAISVCLDAFQINVKVPSWYTGRYWFMRLGYYKFTRAKQIANDWVWIIDHSVQIGQEKCLLILGARLSELPIDRPLSFSDLEPIDLIPMRKSNGEIVYTQLEETIIKTGVPRQIISDHGPDIKAGITKFLSEHPETCCIYDIKHKTAAILKKILNNDTQWNEFIKECATAKKQLQQTELAFLAPPNQRAKARYMNVDLLITWGTQVLEFMDRADNYNHLKSMVAFNLSKTTPKYSKTDDTFNLNYCNTLTNIDHKRLQEKLGWIVKYRDKLNELERVMAVISTAESFIRSNGYTTSTLTTLYNKLHNYGLCEQSVAIKWQLIEFVRMESEKAKPNETLIGSSEIIESLFGKQKFLSNEQSKSGFTGLIVSIGAFVATTTREVVMNAMETVKTHDVTKWIESTIGNTVQSLRNTMLKQCH